MTLHLKITEALVSIDHKVEGAAASEASVRRLFRMDDLDVAPKLAAALAPRFCEEHLSAALVAARQAVQDRQLFFNAGERYAMTALSLSADVNAQGVLKDEAEAAQLRAGVAKALTSSEKNALAAATDQYRVASDVAASLDPEGQWARWDAHRASLLAFNTQDSGRLSSFGNNQQVDHPPSDPGPPAWTFPKTHADQYGGHVTRELTQRSTIAQFRVAHDRAALDVAAAHSVEVAAKGRAGVSAASEQFESSAAAIVESRARLAGQLLEQRKSMMKDLALLDFEGQMRLHFDRAQDLLKDAAERAAAAAEGIEVVYGVKVSRPPTVGLSKAEQLLTWCRETARTLVAHEPQSIRQRVTVSLKQTAGAAWPKFPLDGLRIDLSWLKTLGRVVRIRDVDVRAVGKEQSSFLVKLILPRDVSDHGLDGALRPKLVQQSPELTLIALAPSETPADANRGSVRTAHNLCPSGEWRFVAKLPADVDDVLLGIDVAYFSS